jgi:hypothetical protein
MEQKDSADKPLMASTTTMIEKEDTRFLKLMKAV